MSFQISSLVTWTAHQMHKFHCIDSWFQTQAQAVCHSSVSSYFLLLEINFNGKQPGLQMEENVNKTI